MGDDAELEAIGKKMVAEYDELRLERVAHKWRWVTFDSGDLCEDTMAAACSVLYAYARGDELADAIDAVHSSRSDPLRFIQETK